MEGPPTSANLLGRPRAVLSCRSSMLRDFLFTQDIMIDTILEPVGGFEPSRSGPQNPQSNQMYTQALDLCRFVLGRVTGQHGKLSGAVDTEQVYQLQKVLYTSVRPTIIYFKRPSSNLLCQQAAIRSNLPSNEVSGELIEYSKAVELAVGPSSIDSPVEHYTLRDLTLAIYVAGLLTCSSPQAPFPADIATALSEEGPPFFTLLKSPDFNMMYHVRKSGEKLLDILGPSMPAVLLTREQALRLPLMIWPSFNGILPGIVKFTSATEYHLPDENIRQRTHYMTSKIILALAKRMQESMVRSPLAIPGFGEKLRASLPLVLVLNYLALSLSPSPANYNNLGILLSVITATRAAVDVHGAQHLVTGHALSRSYYEGGLILDPNSRFNQFQVLLHTDPKLDPHLLTNMGSLLKDEGRVHESIQSVSPIIGIMYIS